MVPKKTIHWYLTGISRSRDSRSTVDLAMGYLPTKVFIEKKRDQPVIQKFSESKQKMGSDMINYDKMFCETGETKFKMTSSSAVSGFGSRHFDASSFWIHIPIRNTCYLICQNMLPGKKKQGWAKKRNSFWLNIHLFTIHPTITSRLPGCYISSKCSHGIPQCCWYIHPTLLNINSHCIPIKITSKHIKTMILFHHIPMDMPFTFHHFPFDFPTSSSFHHSKSQHFSSVLPVLLHRNISQDPRFGPVFVNARHVPPGRRPHSPARDSHPRCTSERRPRPCLWPRFPRWAPWIGWKRSPPEFSADFWRGFLGQMLGMTWWPLGNIMAFISWECHGMTMGWPSPMIGKSPI